MSPGTLTSSLIPGGMPCRLANPRAGRCTTIWPRLLSRTRVLRAVIAPEWVYSDGD